MFFGFKIIGMGTLSPGDWYAGLKKHGDEFVLEPMQFEADDFFVAGATVIKLEPLKTTTIIPHVLKAPWLAMDVNGRWLAWWFEPILDSDDDGEFWSCDAPESVPESQMCASLDIISHYVAMDLSKLPNVDDWRQSKMLNPWYAQ